MPTYQPYDHPLLGVVCHLLEKSGHHAESVWQTTVQNGGWTERLTGVRVDEVFVYVRTSRRGERHYTWVVNEPASRGCHEAQAARKTAEAVLAALPLAVKNGAIEAEKEAHNLLVDRVCEQASDMGLACGKAMSYPKDHPQLYLSRIIVNLKEPEKVTEELLLRWKELHDTIEGMVEEFRKEFSL